MRTILSLALACVAAVATLGADERASVPLAVGNRWEYAVTVYGVISIGEGENSRSMETSATGTCIEEVVAVKERRPNGDIVYEHRTTTSMDAGVNSEPSESGVEALMMSSKQGTLILASRSTGFGDVLTNEWEYYDPPLVLFGSGLTTGKKWKIGTIREGTLRMPMEAQVAGYETVTVPAGTFRSCLKIYGTCSKITGTMGKGKDLAVIKSGKSVSTIWLYPGIGVVKEDNVIQTKMEFPNDPSGRNQIMIGTQRKIKELKPGYRAG